MRNAHIQKRLQEFISASSRPLVVILGPTASGKTGLSVDLALTLGNADVINGDSRQLYRHLDIGTAKITPDEMRGVPHHLLNVLDPEDEVTAAQYKRMAESAIDDCHRRGRVPMLVGGSMLYISAVIDGLEFPATPDSQLRSRLSADYDADGGAALYAKLTEIDPETAAAFSVKNKPYVLRAMEIWESTKEKPSQARQKRSCPYDLFIIGIERDRETLAKRIDLRTTELFERGWIDEVRGLLAQGYRAEDPAMKSHGYREIIAFLESGTPSRKELQELIAAKARQYAKRQMTWWKGDERIEWITLE